MCPAQLPGAPHALATDGLIEINLYKRRAGVEGTLSQGVRAFGLRRTRYWGVAKTHLQHVAIAAAINIDRLVAWLDERPRALTRISRFAALAPANADNPGEAAA